MADVVRWQPRVNYTGDKPMYLSTKGGWVTYQDFKKVYEENQRLTAELTALYLKIAGIGDEEPYGA